MISLKQLRVMLNMTQADVAQYLKVPMSVLSMAESGLRSLPSKKINKLVELGVLSMEIKEQQETVPEFKVPRLPVQEEKNREKMAYRIIHQTHHISLLERKLAEMQENYSRAVVKAKVMEHLKNSLEEEGETLYERDWCGVQRNKAIREIGKYGPSLQKMLRIKIALAKAEIAITKEILDEDESTHHIS